jgi:glycosyltransferase involved in cell wall biosynthesis
MLIEHVQSIVVLDPGMSQIAGHHLAYNTLLKGAFASWGIPAVFFFSCHLPEDVQALFPTCAAVLGAQFYSGHSATDDGAAAAADSQSAAFAEELSSLLCELNSRVLVLAHTLNPLALLGIARWYAALAEDKRPRLALNLMVDVRDTPKCRELIAKACALFNAADKRVRLFGATRRTAAVLTEIFARSCSTLPTPLPDDLARFRQVYGAGVPSFGMLGDGRKGKGLNLLAPSILRYLSSGGKGDFYINVTPTDVNIVDDMVALYDVWQTFSNRIRLDQKYWKGDAYYRLMGGFSVLLVPYVYDVCRPSGLVIESVVMGVPAITGRGGFMEDELVGLDNGTLFVDKLTPSALSEAFFLFDEQARERKARAMAAAPRYGDKHGSEALRELLLQTDPMAFQA